eukprot:TRINITY_DN39495_c0_g1_i2.p1 TRINITY_DN39495_c0_g1~~TRINITY_DN39495_c0_g1_i2.p1  ORF type:complete len:205 (-),score=93.70 TRINITY_DN39495_c0_g1_i2:181-795(-)
MYVFVVASYGVDVSQPVSESAFKCLRGQNLQFAIVRCFHSYGEPDTNAPATVAAAWAGGMAHVDVYMFPCPKCGNAAGQASKAVSYLRQHGVKYGMMWLDIEQPSLWTGSHSSNIAFFRGLLTQLDLMGVRVGIYSSAYMWNSIFGSSYKGPTNYSLWYAHYDGEPSFSDFTPFGGWSHPGMKQFSDAGSKCGVSYDINWYPPL